MSRYYGVAMSEYDKNYLAHHGIKGQKWGVRRYQNEDGTLTAEGRQRYGIDEGGNKKLGRLYKHEVRKLKRLKNRTDIDLQKARAAKYDKLAKAGVKAAVAGVGTAAAVSGLNNILKDNYKLKNELLERDWNDAFSKLDRDVRSAWRNDKSFNTKTGYSDSTWNYIDMITEDFNKKSDEIEGAQRANTNKFNKGANIRKAIATGAGVVSAAGLATAAFGKVMSNIAKQRVTDIGHEKAVKKYQERYDRAMKTFGGTAFSDLLKNEIDNYKKEHPNLKLSDKQIAKNLR